MTLQSERGQQASAYLRDTMSTPQARAKEVLADVPQLTLTDFTEGDRNV